MPEQFSQAKTTPASNLFHFPIRGVPSEGRQLPNQEIPTPKSDKIFEQVEKLKRVSQYQSQFDYETYRKLELRFGLRQPSSEITFSTPFKLESNLHSHKQGPNSFEIDTYSNQLSIPIDISDIWETLYTVFETDKNSKFRSIMEKRTPLKIGSISESFIFMDQRYGVTKELLRILDFYKYPYIIFTRSDLVAQDDYMKLLNPKLCSIQTSISSTNDEMNKLIEKGTPSAKRRLLALQKLNENGFWTTIKISPFFPIYADGYYTDPNFDRKNMPEPFHYSSFEMVDEIASYGITSVFAEMVKLSLLSLNEIEKSFGRDLKSLYKLETNKKNGNFYYSLPEIRAYYDNIKTRCSKNAIDFTYSSNIFE